MHRPPFGNGARCDIFMPRLQWVKGIPGVGCHQVCTPPAPRACLRQSEALPGLGNTAHSPVAPDPPAGIGTTTNTHTHTHRHAHTHTSIHIYRHTHTGHRGVHTRSHACTQRCTHNVMHRWSHTLHAHMGMHRGTHTRSHIYRHMGTHARHLRGQMVTCCVMYGLLGQI